MFCRNCGKPIDPNAAVCIKLWIFEWNWGITIAQIVEMLPMSE